MTTPYHFIRFNNFGAVWKTRFVYLDIVRKTDPFLPSFGDSFMSDVGEDGDLETAAGWGQARYVTKPVLINVQYKQWDTAMEKYLLWCKVHN